MEGRVRGTDTLESPPRPVERPLRLSITDVFKAINVGGTVSIGGKVRVFPHVGLSTRTPTSLSARTAAAQVDAGVVAVGDSVVLMPSYEAATVKGPWA
jgi:translation elongation factor EF-1alpha